MHVDRLPVMASDLVNVASAKPLQILTTVSYLQSRETGIEKDTSGKAAGD